MVKRFKMRKQVGNPERPQKRCFRRPGGVDIVSPGVPKRLRGGGVTRLRHGLRRQAKTANRLSAIGGPDNDAESAFCEGVSFFRLSLACRAAPGLGCGTRAKPVLIALEINPAVNQAWLDRHGSMLAIMWSDARAQRSHRDAALAILKKKRLGARELTGAARTRALESFLSGVGWFRAAAVDRLSEEEAGIIAARLVRRLTATANLFDGKAETLRMAFTDACKRELTENPATSSRARRNRIAKAVLKAGRQFLDENQFLALKKAVAMGHRPVAGED